MRSSGQLTVTLDKSQTKILHFYFKRWNVQSIALCSSCSIREEKVHWTYLKRHALITDVICFSTKHSYCILALNVKYAKNSSPELENKINRRDQLPLSSVTFEGNKLRGRQMRPFSTYVCRDLEVEWETEFCSSNF